MLISFQISDPKRALSEPVRLFGIFNFNPFFELQSGRGTGGIFWSTHGVLFLGKKFINEKKVGTLLAVRLIFWLFFVDENPLNHSRESPRAWVNDLSGDWEWSGFRDPIKRSEIQIRGIFRLLSNLCIHVQKI
jgi:hypothetical protein